MKTTKSKSKSSGNGKAKKAGTITTGAEHQEGFMKLFEDELKDIYWAEKALTKALPKMMKKATSEELVAAIEEHLEVTLEQVAKVEQVFGLLDKTARGKKCEAMAGLIKEAEEMMAEIEEGPVRDAAIISSAQKVEHYEIASYGTLCAFAKLLQLDEAAEILHSILEEEKEADMKLTEVAESYVNEEALAEG